ncbi:dnaJ homolog subfamily C member 15 isoform X1 [Corapipo altera]|uniref:dnaJ homolog subfamily C member 15 isoform X1 n=1 Tax=Corapipo altera TaxID=415028 RepID=UPI000FD6AE00|nr:dnaJ homolog subfamily C member 15 isoform X1 [Corapipo altera]
MAGAAGSDEGLRYAEYARGPTAAGRGQTELDRGLARTMIAVGLGVATVAFAGRYAFHLWKPLEQAITETTKRISTSSFSSYYKGGFEQKMSRREASLILGVRWITLLSNKNKRSKRLVGIQCQKLKSEGLSQRRCSKYIAQWLSCLLALHSFLFIFIVIIKILR